MTAAAPVSDEVLSARAYLGRVAEPACVPLWALIEQVGVEEAAARVRTGRGLSPALRAAVQSRHDKIDPQADLDAAERLGIRLVVPESPDWPHFAMNALDSRARRRLLDYDLDPHRYARSGEPIPPVTLWVAGPLDLRTLGMRAAGIVGARTSTAYGNRVARTMARGLAERDVVVVSGGAYGIDRAAHDGALDVGGETVLVSAGGLHAPYPPAHADLFARVRETGLLLSESPPGATPQRRRFLSRNRLIACLATGTVVVEAANRSGALNTAGHCAELGRPLMAVPGPVESAMSVGCHTLLRREDRGASLVTCADDVLEVIGSSSDLSATPTSTGPVGGAPSVDRVRRVLDGLDAAARAVFDGMSAGRPVDTDELAMAAGLPIPDVLAALPALQLAGLVELDIDGYRIRR